jgi:hypothetical protein
LATKAARCGQGIFITALVLQQTVDQLENFLDRLGVAACCGAKKLFHGGQFEVV